MRTRTQIRSARTGAFWLAVSLLVVAGACTDGGNDGETASTVTTATTGVPQQPERTVDLSGLDLAPLAMVSDGQSVWLAGSGAPEHGRVVRVDVEAGTAAWSVAVPDAISGLAFDTDGVLWAVGGGDGADPNGGITRLEAESGQVLDTLEVPGRSPSAVAIGPTAVWVTDGSSNRLWKVDRARGTISATVQVAEHPAGIAFGYAGESLWVASPGPGMVTRIDAETGATQGTLPVPTANSVVATPSAIWVGGEQLVRIDPTTGEQVASIPTPGVTVVRGMSNGWVWTQQVLGGIFRWDVEALRLESTPVATGEFAAVAVTGESAWIYDPAGERLVEKRLPLVSDLDFAAEQPREGSNVGYIRGFDGRSLSVDLVEALVHPEATEVALLDGFWLLPDDQMPNDYYDRNRDGRTHQLTLGSDPELVVLRFTGDITPTEVDISTFAHALQATEGGEFFGSPRWTPFRLTIENGWVVRAEQLYRP